MTAGGDGVTVVRSVPFFHGCSEAEEGAYVSSSPLEENHPYIVANIYEPTPLDPTAARNIARQIGQTVAWVQEQAKTAQGLERIKALLRAAPKSTGGCGGGSSVQTSTGSSTSSGNGAVEGNARVMLDAGWLVILGVLLYRAATSSPQGAAANLLFGITFGTQEGPEA